MQGGILTIMPGGLPGAGAAKATWAMDAERLKQVDADNTVSIRHAVLAATVAMLLIAAEPVAAAAEKLSFDVNVTLSEKALAKLGTLKEGIIISAAYYGDPRPSFKKHVDETGHINLGSGDEEVELPASGGRATVTGSKVDTTRLVWLSGPVQINVNVYSARKSNSDNLLSCDFIDGPLADVVNAPVPLHCTLIDEGTDVKRKP